MNMIFHNIRNARIEQGDTLLNPKLVTGCTLNQYDIVVANPPFSQNYTTANMQFKERFQNWMSKKKQADFMFVQHMISVLKNNGRMAVVMPHGVLFRGGEEQKMRQRLIVGSEGHPSCILECVIGLPQALFYGTGIPASLLIINKAGAADRQGVFFINADREYKEGKNQNSLRPEDIEKISYVYHNKIEIEGYSRMVSRETLAAEDYNCNIRRYVDNSEPPTPQDVKAHLQGGSLFDFNNNLTDRFVATLTNLNVLDKYQVRGSFAHFSDMLKSDFRSVQSSGWTAELIPDNELIANEFPEVLSDLKRLENRRDELDAKFAEIAEMDPEEWDAEQYEVMPKTIISEVKAEIKELKAQKRELAKLQKALEKRRKLGETVTDKAARCAADITALDKQIADKEVGIAHHVELENELKDCRKKIREIEQNKEKLADKAREQISDDDTRRLITQRRLAILHDNIAVYLEAHARSLQQSVELLHDKYSVTLQNLIEERDEATKVLDDYLKELGYANA